MSVSSPGVGGMSNIGPALSGDHSQYAGNRAATVKMSGVPSLGADAAFDFLGVRLWST